MKHASLSDRMYAALGGAFAHLAGGIRRAMGRPVATMVLLLLVGGLAAFLLWPIWLTIQSGFRHEGQISAYWFVRIWDNAQLTREMVNSLTLACTTTLACMVVALPMALLRARCRFPGQGLLSVLVLVPMILPPFVGALSIRRLLSQYGALNLLLAKVGILDFSQSLPPDWLGAGFAGVVLLQTMHLFPILYLNATAALANVDPSLSAAARNLGAGPLQTFFRVTLPMIRPGLFAGGTIVFIWSLTDIGTPLIVGYQELTPVTIFKEISRGEVAGRIFSLVFLLLSGSVTLYVLGKFLFGRQILAESSKAGSASSLRKLGPLGTLGAWGLFGSVLIVSVLPHLGVILLSISQTWVNTVLPSSYTLDHLKFVLTQPTTYTSILNSLRYAGVSTGVDLVLGGLAAWLIVRTRLPGRSLLDGLAMLPLAVPGLILAAGYVAMTVQGAWLEELGPMGRWPFVILIIAYTVRRLPFAVRSISAGLQQVPVSLEEASRNLGAGRVRTVGRITLPLIAANVIAAAVLTFAFAMLEVSDSLVLAQQEKYYPITKQIYELGTSTGSPETTNQAAALGVYAMGLLAATMGAAGALLGKRLGAIFRA